MDSAFQFDKNLLYGQFYNMSLNLVRLVRQDLVAQDEQVNFIF